jgi:deoxyribonuclease V
MSHIDWPTDRAQLLAVQEELGQARVEPWRPPMTPTIVASYCCGGRARHRRDATAGASDRDDAVVSRGGEDREPGWAAAVLSEPAGNGAVTVVRGVLHGPYIPGCLALREVPLRASAVHGLARRADVLLVDAAGRDHPRRAGLAVHLGAIVEIPTVGVTDRPLVARGPLPADHPGAASPLRIDGEVVGYWLRVVSGSCWPMPARIGRRKRSAARAARREKRVIGTPRPVSESAPSARRG